MTADEARDRDDARRDAVLAYLAYYEQTVEPLERRLRWHGIGMLAIAAVLACALVVCATMDGVYPHDVAHDVVCYAATIGTLMLAGLGLSSIMSCGRQFRLLRGWAQTARGRLATLPPRADAQPDRLTDSPSATG